MKDIKMFRLKPLKEDKIPEHMICFYFDRNEVVWCEATYVDNDFTFTEAQKSTTGCLVEMVKKRKCKGKLWILGSCVYDMLCWQGLYAQLDNKSIDLPKKTNDEGVEVLSQALATSEPTIIDVIVNKQNVHCVDLLNWGITKTESLEDCLMKVQLKIAMTVKLEMGSLQDTAAAQGSTRFRRHDLPEYGLYPHQVEKVRKLERASWYGGRCEAKELGLIKEERWHFDVKSQYASFGLNKKFPTRLIDYSVEESWKSGITNEHYEQETLMYIRNYLKQKLQVIARVELKTNKPIYPLRHKKLTIFPIGNFITVLASPELELAFELGNVVKVYDWALYDCETVFEKNSQWFFNARSKLDEIGLLEMAGPLKLLQNSGYGFIGRRDRKWVDTDKVTDLRWGERVGRHPKTNELCMYRYVDGVNQYLDMDGEPETSLPSIPSVMFSYSRVDLYKYVSIAGDNNTSYYDTDGLIVNRQGRDNLLALEHHLPARPGELVVREYSHDVSFKEKSVDIRGVKHYRFGDTWRQAGVPSNAERDMFGNVKFFQHTPFDISLRSGMPFDHKYDKMSKNWKEIYKHGRVLKNKRTEPFEACIIKDKKTGELINDIH